MRKGSQSRSISAASPSRPLAGATEPPGGDVINPQEATLAQAKRTEPCARRLLQSRAREGGPEQGGGLPRCYDGAMELQERTDSLVSLTPAAAAKISALMAEETDVSVLRVAIEGGGCSGFQYGLGFDRGAQEGDHEFVCEGVKVVVDPFRAPYLAGATGDYLETS